MERTQKKNKQLGVIRRMLKTGVHCGHAIKDLHPRMKPYLFTDKNGKHVIDLSYTLRLVLKAVVFIIRVTYDGGQCLIVSTNPQKAEYVVRYAKSAQCHYITYKWLGGMLTNWKTLQRRIKLLANLEYQTSCGMLKQLPKKEVSSIHKRLVKLRKYFNGIKYMKQKPDMVIVIEQNRERTLIQECRKLAIPVIGFVDTNCDPDMIDIPIPANDDNSSSIKYLLRTFIRAMRWTRARTRAKVAN